MKRDIRTAVYDEELRLEAYRFEGIVQPFPKHFHAYYVIGFVEKGERRLFCKNREYTIRAGDLLLFHPGDSHACTQSGDSALDYRGLNIARDVMLDLAREITGTPELPGFRQTVIQNQEASCYLRSLHDSIMNHSGEFDAEENLLLLLSLLMQQYGQPFERCIPDCRDEIEAACAFMEQHYMEHIDLDQLCRRTALSKSTLLRAFTKSKGVTPYSYLINIRVGQAKRLLELGVPPVEAALQTGFSDQSHFTNCFRSFIGLAPGVYRDIFTDGKGLGGKHRGE